ncbi:MAG: heme-copper oxidase subunit III [candidate division KSB1 bacterium]|nr:heme-copper oxidase subunit III [candidate division KSB1 bacterium]
MKNITATELIVQRKDGSASKINFGESSSWPAFRSELPIDRAFLGLLIFLGAETMFFAGLISAFIILRAGSTGWPPLDQPRLPVAVTGVNTLFLLLSAVTMYRAVKAIRAGSQTMLTLWLSATALLGIIFLGVQGFEWVRLVQFGLTFNSSIYGGTFYTLIGCHGLHVFAAVIALLFVLGRATKRRYTAQHHTGVELCRMYWFFVVGIWPLLYFLVYLK